MTVGGKPGRRCSICIHAHRAAIDAALLAGQRGNDIASEFRVSPDAVSRHRLRHLAYPEGAVAGQVLDTDASSDLLRDVAGLRERVLVLLRRAEAKRDLRSALACVHEAAALLTLHGRITGELAADGTRVAVQVNASSTDPRAAAALRERIAEKLAALAGCAMGVAAR